MSMTESKIKPTISQVIYCLKAECERYPEVCEECQLYGEVGCDHCYDDVTDVAIKCIEELEQYRAIGTVEELQNVYKLCESLEEAVKVGDALVEELKKYQALGTIEECRNAVERMKPKKPIIKAWCPALCPSCKQNLSESEGDGYWLHYTSLERCDCGQKLDWSE